MSLYIHTDAPDRPRHLPQSWRNVSGLHLLDAAALAALGWLPWTDTPRPEHDEIHDYLQAGVEITDAAARRTWTIQRRDTIPTVDEMQAAQISAIKAACGTAIMKRYPDYKQRNLIARGLALTERRLDGTITSDEIFEAAAIRDAWRWVERQRAESDRLEAAVLAVTGTDDEKRRAVAGIVFAPAS